MAAPPNQVLASIGANTEILDIANEFETSVWVKARGESKEAEDIPLLAIIEMTKQMMLLVTTIIVATGLAEKVVLQIYHLLQNIGTNIGAHLIHPSHETAIGITQYLVEEETTHTEGVRNSSKSLVIR